MERDNKSITTSSPSDGHGGTEEHETPTIVRHRYHAGFGDSSGENALPDAGGPVLIHECDPKR